MVNPQLYTNLNRVPLIWSQLLGMILKEIFIKLWFLVDLMFLSMARGYTVFAFYISAQTRLFPDLQLQSEMLLRTNRKHNPEKDKTDQCVCTVDWM